MDSRASGAADDKELQALLDEQLAYYRARANEYDDWFFRRGRYDRGGDANQRWRDEVEQVRAALDDELDRLDEGALEEGAQVLELACGTGLWTERLASRAPVLAVDAAPEVLACNRERLRSAGLESRVRYRETDLFGWWPDERAALVFFGFWISHVPEPRFEAFWRRVDRALAPGGRFFFVDNRRPRRREPGGGPEGARARRTLADGRAFEIVKVFHEPAVLERRLSAMGYDVAVRGTQEFFLFGAGGRR